MVPDLDEAVDLDIDIDIDDDELAALALAADADAPVDPDAVPLRLGGNGAALLPDWYMPMPTATSSSTLRRWAIGGIVAALVAVNAAGLCVTYGFPEIAW